MLRFVVSQKVADVSKILTAAITWLITHHPDDGGSKYL
jgi:hypothetical protein